VLPFLIAIFLYGQVSAKELSPQKASVEGVVFDGAGKAVPGVMVSISTNSTLSGEDGHFRMQSVDPGKRELRFSKNGFNSKRVTYDFAEGQLVRDVVIRLAKLATISGRLFDSNGQPLAGAVVIPLHYAVLERDGRRELMSSIPAITDDRGQFRA